MTVISGWRDNQASNRRRLTVREKIDDTASFEIADDAAVALPALPSPVINADDVQGSAVANSMPAHRAQQGILADRQHQAPRQRSRGPTSQGDAEVMDDRFEPSGAPG
jgi:hypothetical protein